MKPDTVSAEVVSCEEILSNVFKIVFTSQHLSKSVPGNFMMVRPGDATDPLLRRPFAVSGIDGDRVEILLQLKGMGTAQISRYACGQRVDILGPLGNCFKLPDTHGAICLVAGGMGIAPLLFLARTLTAKGRDFILYYGAVSKNSLLPLETLGLSAENICYVTEDGSAGFHGRVSDALFRSGDRDVPGGRKFDTVCCCGPLPMASAVYQLVSAAGLHFQVSLEEKMACGVGACLGCVVPDRCGGYKRVCADGPVFDGNEIDWR